MSVQDLIAEADDYAQRGWGEISDFAARASKALKRRSRKPEAAPSDTDLIGFIDQTLYANRDSSPDVKWRNSEVLRLLEDVRRLATSQPVQVEVTDDIKRLIDRLEKRMDTTGYAPWKDDVIPLLDALAALGGGDHAD